MHFSLFTLFPELIRPWTEEALLGKAAERELIHFDLIDLRNFSGNKHRKVDDTPYGGGAGMVIRPDVVGRALESVQTTSPPDEIVLLTPAGKPFTQRTAEELSTRTHLAFLCGRYEGFDARVEQLVTREVSIGDFVMMGGEAAAVCLIEAIARLIPGVIGDEASHHQDSFSSGLLDYPEYTRPLIWNEQPVPEVLRGGHHAQIERWRRDEALARTLARRPDLLALAQLSAHDTATLEQLGVTQEQFDAWKAPAPFRPKNKKRKKPSSAE